MWLGHLALVVAAAFAGAAVYTRIPRVAGNLLARISEIWSDLQQLAASSVAAPWNTRRVNRMTGLCGSSSTAA
jgi:hypothetical protein